MFSSVLVANRGEIAARIFRTAKRLGLATVAVYADADAKALHVRQADRAVRIGASPAVESYLLSERIIAAAKETGAEAIHPGYGFLSENPEFAEAAIAAGLIWIGPQPSAIRAMGLKDEAKRIAIAAGVPVLPGYLGEDQTEKQLLKAAKEIGYPVLIKAVAGGGGRGIREASAPGDFAAALASAKREASAAFKDDRVLIEKLVARPRHIEVQVFGDTHGELVHVFERECSLQRRRQKVIEEAPAPGMTDDVRAAMTAAALKVAAAVSYQNAGTVEFIVDGQGPLRPDGFWFLEMNTRLQVEHPVTEEVTGLDLVEWQFRVAAGERLPLPQNEIRLSGAAIEARICAEDCADGFRPSIGRFARFDIPEAEGVRLDTGFETGDAVSPFYDSLIAKAIVHKADRTAALEAIARAMASVCADGVTTNAAFLAALARDGDVRAGAMHVGLIQEKLAALTANTSERDAELALALALFAAEAPSGPWAMADGFRLNGAPQAVFAFDAGGKTQSVRLTKTPAGIEAVAAGAPPRSLRHIQLHRGGDGLLRVAFEEAGQVVTAHVSKRAGGWRVFLGGQTFAFLPPGAAAEQLGLEAGDEVKAPLPGKIVALSAEIGKSVKKGDALLTLEAMKMEHTLKAPRDGVIADVAASLGALVKEGAVLVRLAAEG